MMSRPDPFALLRASYAAATFASPEARIAAVVTLAVALCVFAFARVPLSGEIDVDFREGDRISGVAQATLIGFSAPDANGRVTHAPLARVVFNRPLPARFALALEAHAEGAPAVATIRVGDERRELRFDAAAAPHELALGNPSGAREIAIELAPGGSLRLRRLAVRDADGPA